MAKKIEIAPGTRFGNLIYIRDGKPRTLPSGQKPRTARCKCDCGRVANVLFLHLIRNRANNCGCRKHGDVGKPLYRVWRAMINRCEPNYFQSQYYYQKGISVCEKWRNSYKKFKQWAIRKGYKEGLQIDRKKNHLGYYPNNCHFVTQIINMANRDITVMVNYRGKDIALSMLCAELGYNQARYDLILGRINRGWNHQKAIDEPPRSGNYRNKPLKVKNIKTGKIYDGLASAAKDAGLTSSYLSRALNGVFHNKTDFRLN